ncbi:C-type lectin BML-1-like [Cebidichthys violaceus]|uniref:C-type lectin BML-1-like n=1 Tax=Cebidichthys violaceus TaxID=271503 RepID=UPI0035C9E8F1
MRLFEVTALLLLVVMMSMSHSAAAPTKYLDELCANPTKCEGINDNGWFPLGEGRCVKAFNSTDLNFENAEKACNQYTSDNNFTAHLVSIHSMKELDQVVCAMYTVTPRRPPYWIGLNLTYHYENNLIYDWTDGTGYDFDYFAYQQPNFYNQEQECVEINYNYWGQWNDVNCIYTRPYVCAVKVR